LVIGSTVSVVFCSAGGKPGSVVDAATVSDRPSGTLYVRIAEVGADQIPVGSCRFCAKLDGASNCRIFLSVVLARL
jgi:hypothetical protein